MLNALQSVFFRHSDDSPGFYPREAEVVAREIRAPSISRLVVSVALPAYMISNLMGSYDRAKLISMLPGASHFPSPR